MPRHCCTTWGNSRCRANFSKKDTETTYLLPTDPCERERWINALPNKLNVCSKSAAICAKHWPPNFATVRKKGAVRPRDPPSLFGGVPKSTFLQTKQRIKNRHVQERKCTSAARRELEAERCKAKKEELDKICSWNDMITFCGSLPDDLIVKKIRKYHIHIQN